MSTTRLFLFLLLSGLSNYNILAQVTAPTILEDNVNAAKKVLEAFPKQAIQLDFSDADRHRWSNLPIFLHERKGVSMDDMSDAQKIAMQKLLQAALSESGYLKTNWIFWLDERRKEEMIIEESNVYQHYGQGKFWLTIFGNPSIDSNWAWRLEGHHLSINMTFREGKIYMTPLFLGAHPSVVQDGPFAGLEAMSRETTLARRLFSTLDSKQRRAAIIESEAYDDILTRSGQEMHIKKPQGVDVETFSEQEQALVMKIVRTYLDNYRKGIASSYLENLKASDLKFAWAGTGKYEDGIYYRIQSPKFVIEYDHRNQDIGHIHAVFYDMEGAFGGKKIITVEAKK